MIMEIIGTSYLTSTINGNIRWAAAELFEVPEDDEDDEAMVSYRLAGADMQGTLLQCEG
ncbi:hypothetical protein AZE42_06561 [Rhizopogon vesiculosus]|uniref:Uncharacterized protein n=1 Tax=Rhizopogon vesiculosus TaxID=180088 RepID=A0A1J8PNM9_9AGAM|nr:hypothetical protein AZE42_06561 [Rhizopogon vesiculosus]